MGAGAWSTKDRAAMMKGQTATLRSTDTLAFPKVSILNSLLPPCTNCIARSTSRLSTRGLFIIKAAVQRGGACGCCAARGGGSSSARCIGSQWQQLRRERECGGAGRGSTALSVRALALSIWLRVMRLGTKYPVRRRAQRSHSSCSHRMSAKLQKGVTDLSAVEKLAGRTRQCVQPGPGTFAPLADSEVDEPPACSKEAGCATDSDGSIAHDGRLMWPRPCPGSNRNPGGHVTLFERVHPI